MTNEDRIQKAVVDYFRIQHPEYIVFAIPNGGSRNVREAAKLRRCGVLAGIPDLCVLTPEKPIFIEIKTEGGRLQQSQKDLHPKMEALGYPVAVCRSIDDVKEVLAL